MTIDGDHACAAIDVGSHSVKLTAVRDDGDRRRSILERVEVTGLGGGEPRRDGLAPATRERTLAVLADFADELRRRGVARIVTVGTAVLRTAPDAAAFVAAVGERTGLALEIITGEEEARLTYLGAVVSLPEPAGAAPQLVFDIGGASCELAWGRRHDPDDRRSLDIGTITLTRDHGLGDAAPAERIDTARARIDRMLDTVPAPARPARLVGIGATPTTLLALDRAADIADSAEVHGQALALHTVDEQIARLAVLDAVERRRLPGLHPDRARVVLAGAVITAAIAARWPEAPLVLSGHGLRAGLLRDRFGPGR